MIYNIKSIPTKYSGVQFRSRLEAKWAAFFDQIGVDWEYEPFDMDGWTPDFKIEIENIGIMVNETYYKSFSVLAEVKPIDLNKINSENPLQINKNGRDVSSINLLGNYKKAINYCKNNNVILLGISPVESICFGFLCETVSDNYFIALIDSIMAKSERNLSLVNSYYCENTFYKNFWKAASNETQWNRQ